MTNINVYGKTGELENTITIDDELTYVDGRVSKGNKCYYKGTGLPYDGHYILEEPSYEYNKLGEPDIFYLGYHVKRKVWDGKYGIFKEPYQPFFLDHVGSCAGKEGTVLLNSMRFEKSSIEIYDCIEIDRDDEQYYYEVDYKCKRRTYMEGGSPEDLMDLLLYMLESNWNFLWDKGAINDISYNGLVTDPADLFYSEENKHKLGTVYAVLYSLAEKSASKFKEFMDHIGLHHHDNTWFVMNALWMMKEYVDINSMLLSNVSHSENYRHLVKNYLLTGKNCAYCACDAFIDQGDKVMQQYLEKFGKLVDTSSAV